MKLSLAERLSLRNQLLIMQTLKVPGYSSRDYDEMIEIVQGGYEIFYSDLVSGLSEEGADPAVTSEVMEILDLFRALDSAKRSGVNIAGGNGYGTFAGFDANNDEHYGFSVFILDVKGLYAESAPAKNSHSSATLGVYRRMVSVWQSLGRSHALSQADVDAILK